MLKSVVQGGFVTKLGTEAQMHSATIQNTSTLLLAADRLCPVQTNDTKLSLENALWCLAD